MILLSYMLSCSLWSYFQIFDAGDFSVLCSVISPRGERWLGGHFLSPEKVLVWTDDGKAYMYKLPAKWVPSAKVVKLAKYD